MVYLDLILNLSLLVALSVVSGFLDKRFPRETRTGALLQGALFGAVAVLGMLRPLFMGPGLIFDGRTVMLSLCALFFGPWATLVACVMTLAYRVPLGGAGLVMGVSTILSSSAIGLAAYYRCKPSIQPPSMALLFGMGLIVHTVMVSLMFTLPAGVDFVTFKRLGLPILLLYPLATILAGTILSDHLSTTQAAAVLGKSEERYRLLFDASLDAVLLTAPDGRILAANPAACSIFGRSEEEIKTVGRMGIMDNTDPRWAKALEEQTRTGKFAGELTFLRHDGSKFSGEISMAIFQDQDNQIRTSMIIRDITDRKRKEQALLEKEVQYRNLANTGLALIWTSGTDKLCTYFNEPWLEFTGRTLEQELGNGWTEGVHRDDLERCVDIYVSAFDQRKSFDMEYRLRHASGQYRWIRDLGTPNYSGSGEFVGYIGHCFDITEAKIAQEEIRKLNDELERKIADQTRDLRDNQTALLNLVDDLNENAQNLTVINQSLEEVNRELAAFSYSVSHDLRAPLRSIDGFGNALLEDCANQLSDEGKDYLNRIRRAAQNMGRLIDDMLNLSRVTQSEFHRQDFDLSDMVRHIAGEERVNSQNRAVVDIQNSVLVNADQRLMHIAMINLLGNAWKFTGKSEHPHIAFGTDVQNGETVIFVRDNGVGFDMAYAGKLFGTFQRLHRTDEFPGTGVGLATVQRIIKRHGGRIWAESTPDKGATFYFTLGA
ncbi:MAG: PAS domain S-box protein [Smithellaceae bacterium]|jgi:PAS domain S-box-containing protein